MDGHKFTKDTDSETAALQRLRRLLRLLPCLTRTFRRCAFETVISSLELTEE